MASGRFGVGRGCIIRQPSTLRQILCPIRMLACSVDISGLAGRPRLRFFFTAILVLAISGDIIVSHQIARAQDMVDADPTTAWLIWAFLLAGGGFVLSIWIAAVMLKKGETNG